jgi:hypothetical protein
MTPSRKGSKSGKTRLGGGVVIEGNGCGWEGETVGRADGVGCCTYVVVADSADNAANTGNELKAP